MAVGLLFCFFLHRNNIRTMAQQVALSECYIQVYELQPPGAKVKAEPNVGNGDAAMKVEASSSGAAEGDVKVKVEETK